MLCARGRNRRVSPLGLRGLRSLSSGRLQRRPGAGASVVGSVTVSVRVLIRLLSHHGAGTAGRAALNGERAFALSFRISVPARVALHTKRSVLIQGYIGLYNPI